MILYSIFNDHLKHCISLFIKTMKVIEEVTLSIYTWHYVNYYHAYYITNLFWTTTTPGYCSSQNIM